MDREVLACKINETSGLVDIREAKEKLKNRLEKYGSNRTLIISLEECSELMNELAKVLNKNGEYTYDDYIGIAEEIADVVICLELISIITAMERYDALSLKDSNITIEESIISLTKLQKGVCKYLRTGKLSPDLLNGYRETWIAVTFLPSEFHIGYSTIRKIIKIKLDREVTL